MSGSARRRALGSGPGPSHLTPAPSPAPAERQTPPEPNPPEPKLPEPDAPGSESRPPSPVAADHAAPGAPERAGSSGEEPPGEEPGEEEDALPATPGAHGSERPDDDRLQARGTSGSAASGEPAERATDVKDATDAHDGRFRVVLANFEGPFDLLLQLISKHRLDVTEVALSRVTDDFMAHIRAMGPDFDLDQASEFLVVAATLLDLKAARLLPTAQVEDEADLALLEARDLLFARLLQYRAYKQVAEIFAGRLAAEAHRHPRTVGLEPHHAKLLPEVVISLGAEGLARLAAKAMQPKPKPQIYVDHLHAPLVSVREQAAVVVARLRERGEFTFAELVRDASDTRTVVARFLALLELYRERAVDLDQAEALGPLTIRWRAAADGQPLVTDEFDREAGVEPPNEKEQT